MSFSIEPIFWNREAEHDVCIGSLPTNNASKDVPKAIYDTINHIAEVRVRLFITKTVHKPL